MSIRVHPCLMWGGMKLARWGDGPEIFHTLQGEGASAGCPAVFIRASLCNLHCIWCDSEHTWNFQGTAWPHRKDADPAYRKPDKTSQIVEISPQDAAESILAFDCPRVVITGGEPLLQQEDFAAMIDHIRRARPDAVFEVETNGTLVPGPAFAAAIDQFNVSPKLSNSAINQSLRLKPAALEAFASLPNAWFKFVVATPADLLEIKTLQQDFSLSPARIILMPEGCSAAALDAVGSWLADACRESSWRYGDRLHIRLWGDRRGV